MVCYVVLSVRKLICNTSDIVAMETLFLLIIILHVAFSVVFNGGC